MKSNKVKSLLIISGIIIYHILRLRIIPGKDGQKHSTIATIIPDCLDFSDSLWMTCHWLIVLVPMILIMLLIHKPQKIWSELGLSDKRFFQSITIGFLFTIPMFVVNAICGELYVNWDKIGICFVAGIFEELVFRGYLFGQLFRNCRWGFLSATLISSLIFGFLHLYQGHDVVSTLLAVLVTGAGGILFSWMYVEWNYRLWIPMSLHAFMDVAWIMFPVGEEGYGAAGNLATNIGRIITVALVIYATIYFKHKRGEKCLDFKKI